MRGVSVASGIEAVRVEEPTIAQASRGLTTAEATARLAEYGPNLITTHRRRRLVLEFLSRFTNPLIVVLLVASGISALTGDIISFIIISIVVFISVTLDFVQEYRADKAAEGLKASVALRTSVIRDSIPRELPVTELVPGDMILLAAGDLIPADGRVVEASDFFVNQALLTGEPYPVEKHPSEAPDPDESPARATNFVCMGTSVVSGSARVEIQQTGSRTMLGEIAETLNVKPPSTAFEQGTKAFGLMIMRVAAVMVLAVLVINIAYHRQLLESFLFAVALAVGLTPSLLPMIVSVCLARGALRMAAKKVIVKRLAAIDDLGSMDVLCTDKTGTLTEARIRLVQHLDTFGKDSERILLLAYLNSFFETGVRSPLDEAILQHEAHPAIEQWHKIDEVPFDFERRRVSVLVDDSHSRLLIVKGAFEDIFRLCTRYESSEPGSLQPLDAAMRKHLREKFDELSREGLRVLGIAWRPVPPDHSHAVVNDETELVFAGYAIFLDPPKTSSAKAVQDLQRCGVTLKVVTGDNELVTQHLCAQLGLKVEGVLIGTDIERLDDPALQAQVERTTLFCRVTPVQKNRIILALKRRGRIVGFLGDGINDAPPLHSADVGLSVDSAVDVAKDAADLILLQPDLGVLYDGVLEGRRTLGNAMKYIMMGMSTNFGPMCSMVGASLIVPFLPLLPEQVLLNNLLYDFSVLPIPMDNVDADYLARPRKWDMAFVRNFMMAMAPALTGFDFLTFLILLRLFHAHEVLFHTGWFVEQTVAQQLAIFVIRTRGNPLRSMPNPWLITTVLAVAALAVALPLLPIGPYLGFMPPPPIFSVLLLAMMIAFLLVLEGLKRGFYSFFAGSES
jgi:P-type Mg2+ transporter